MNQKHFRKRDAILTCLRETDIHPTAEWIFAKLKPEIPDLSIGTVYRNLALFKELGLVVSVGTVSGVERFDADTIPHVHYICTGCGKVLDLRQLRVPEELNQAAAFSSGGSVTNCQLTFSGLCKDCQNQ